jgi:GxxExxY protein
MEELIYPEECYAIMGACFAVYANKGCGFAEPVYHECLEIELRLRNVPAISKPRLAMEYNGHALKQTYEPDFVCYGKIILELKAVTKIASEHQAQIINYLRASRFQLGILANFGHFPRLDWERFANTDRDSKSPPRLLRDQ